MVAFWRGIDVEWDDHSARSLCLLQSESETPSLQISVTDTLRYLATGVVQWEKLELEKRSQVPEAFRIGMSRMYLTSLLRGEQASKNLPQFFNWAETSNLLLSGNLTLTQVADIFYQNAAAEMVNLNYTAWSFQQLTKDERSVLCWTQLVSICQIIGRLVRGGVPAVVHFLDVKFAPNSAIGEQDSETTSLLVAIIKVLEPYIESEDILARSLYGPFLNALQQMKQRNFNYD